jgi:septum formation protein
VGLVQRRRGRPGGHEALMLILASLSPRRRRLLKEARIRHRVLKVDYKETHPRGMGPAAVARKHALGKAMAALTRVANGRILAADTLVYCGGKIIGKPRDLREAEKILLSLQGRWHKVVTAVALLDAKKSQVKKKVLFHEMTKVRLKKMTLKDIRNYFRRVDPLDKAGAYAIQSRSRSIVKEVRGSFSNAVGLPMERLCARMKKL